MLRNFLSSSNTVIKIFQKQQWCTQLRNHKQSLSGPFIILHYTNSASIKYSSLCTKSKMSLASTSISLSGPSLTAKNLISSAEKSAKDKSDDDSHLISKSNISSRDMNTNIAVGEHLLKNIPLRDKSFSILPKNSISSTTMQIQVTTSPRKQNFTTSSFDQTRIEDQNPPCPECEKMYVIYY